MPVLWYKIESGRRSRDPISSSGKIVKALLCRAV
jgi:hypothetical protein